MADNREKQATCPICGYTDTAMDADLLEQSMAEHMRSMHNMTTPVNAANTDLKHTNQEDPADNLGIPGVSAGAAPDPGSAGTTNNVFNNRPT